MRAVTYKGSGQALGSTSVCWRQTRHRQPGRQGVLLFVAHHRFCCLPCCVVVECDMLCERGAAWRTVSVKERGQRRGRLLERNVGRRTVSSYDSDVAEGVAVMAG